MNRTRELMHTVFSLDVRGVTAADADQAAHAAWASLERDEARFNRFRPGSEISRVNAGELELDEASPELTQVIQLGLAAEVRSGGAFSIRDTPGTIDLNGIVKGWAADRALAAVRAEGCPDACLNAGGDIIVTGSPRPGEPWRIGVRSPGGGLLTTLALREGACASSGTWERGEHIRDARTGRPARELQLATVLAGDLTTADTLATAVFALGERGAAWAISEGATGVLALTADGRLLIAGQVPFAAQPGRIAWASGQCRPERSRTWRTEPM